MLFDVGRMWNEALQRIGGIDVMWDITTGMWAVVESGQVVSYFLDDDKAGTFAFRWSMR